MELPGRRRGAQRVACALLLLALACVFREHVAAAPGYVLGSRWRFGRPDGVARADAEARRSLPMAALRPRGSDGPQDGPQDRDNREDRYGNSATPWVPGLGEYWSKGQERNRARRADKREGAGWSPGQGAYWADGKGNGEQYGVGGEGPKYAEYLPGQPRTFQDLLEGSTQAFVDALSRGGDPAGDDPDMGPDISGETPSSQGWWDSSRASRDSSPAFSSSSPRSRYFKRGRGFNRSPTDYGPSQRGGGSPSQPSWADPQGWWDTPRVEHRSRGSDMRFGDQQTPPQWPQWPASSKTRGYGLAQRYEEQNRQNQQDQGYDAPFQGPWSGQGAPQYAQRQEQQGYGLAKRYEQQKNQQSKAQWEQRVAQAPEEPRASGTVKRPDGAEIAWELYGADPATAPVAVVVHGGPGAGSSPRHAGLFGDEYAVVLVDQRGCGKSTGNLATNTPETLVQDLEAVRAAVKADQWLMFGGSWGAALALAYASRYPAHVWGLVLRGVCLMRRSEVDWLYRGHREPNGGAAAQFPREWQKFLDRLPREERADPVAAYYARMERGAPSEAANAARAWADWINTVTQGSLGEPDVTSVTPPKWQGKAPASWGATPASRAAARPDGLDPEVVIPPPPPANLTALSEKDLQVMALRFGVALLNSTAEMRSEIESLWARRTEMRKLPPGALLEAHYHNFGSFDLSAEPLLERIAKMPELRAIPAVAVQGRQDAVCPARTALALQEAWPELELSLINGGHSMSDPAIMTEVMNALEDMLEQAPGRAQAAASATS